jgi:hypothetical protein
MVYLVKVHNDTFKAFEVCLTVTSLQHEPYPFIDKAYINLHNFDGSIQRRGWAEIICEADNGIEATKISEDLWIRTIGSEYKEVKGL